MLQPSAVKKSLLDIIKNMSEHSSDFVLNPGMDMTRKRKCGFEDVLLQILSFENHSLNKELFNFFGEKTKNLPTKSAFVQQRNKLNDKVFPYVFQNFNRAFAFQKRFKGMHLIACDGSDVNLPKCSADKEYFVKYAKSDGGYYQLHLNATYDLLEKRYCDAIIQPKPIANEARALCTMTDRCPFDDRTLYICDRAYPTFNLIAHFCENNRFFLCRIKDPNGPGSPYKHNHLPLNQEYDFDLRFGLTRSHENRYRKHPEAFKCLHPKRPFDYIEENDKTSVYYISYRIVCVRLENGNLEYLATNLPRDEFTSDDLTYIYNLRWGIETSFRSLKYALGLVHFHSVKRSFIIQEVFAKLILYNLTSLIVKYAESVRKNKISNNFEYKVSFDDAVYIVQLYLRRKFSNKLIKALLLRHMSQIKPGEHKPRNVRSQTAIPLNNRA